MALADIPTGGHPRRLNSWKEIAEYLGRDVRTATRWEAEGMPLHRVPGGKGRSVFAFTNEIDEWMASGRQPAAAPSTLVVPPLLTANRRILLAAAACGALLIALIALTNVPPRGTGGMEVSVTPTGVSVTGASGASRVIYRFPQPPLLAARTPARLTDLDRDGHAEVTVAVVVYEETGARQVTPGELIHLSVGGDVRWRFAFDDILTLGEGTASGPWAIADWQARTNGSRTRIAVAAHDYTWWASLVAVLDQDGRRVGTFFNPGWIESVLWLGADRLAVAGFSNARNAAMLALLDADGANGQAPGIAETPFACDSCSTKPPLFYAAFPRSELNIVNGSRFNRAAVSQVGDLLFVTTTEIQDAPVTAIYEFDGDMRLRRARYSDAYWDMHRRLERDGRLTHAREACPERNGPAAIQVWNGADWLRVTPR